MNDIFHTRLGIPQSRPVLCLAPMEGITNRIFRNAILEIGGPDLVATEFIRVTSKNQKIPSFGRHRCPLQIQIMGCSPEIISGNLEFLKERSILGEEDWIDLNVGCPSKRVNAHGSGAALLKSPKTLVSMIEGLRSKHSGPLSIKTRIGFDSTQDFIAILDALKECPLDFISIHARTRQAGYLPGINLEQLARAVETLPYPVIGNGDIWCVEDALSMIQKTGVRGVMCGRGVARNPFLLFLIRNHFMELYPPNISTLRYLEFARSLLEQYIELGKEQNKPDRFLGTFKEFSLWLSKNPAVGKPFFDRLKRCSSVSAIAEIIDREMLSDAIPQQHRCIGETEELVPGPIDI